MKRSRWRIPLIGLLDLTIDLFKLIYYGVIDRIILLKNKPEQPSSPTVLLIRLDLIGDYLLFRPFLEQITRKEREKGNRVILCGNPVWRELAEHFDKDIVDQFIWLDRKKATRSLQYRYRKLRQITAISYKQAINPTYSRDLFFADHIMDLVSAEKKIGCVGDPATVSGWRKKIGDKAYTKLLPTVPAVKFELYRNLEITEKLLGRRLSIPQELLIADDTLVRKFNLPSQYVALFISASSDFRKWPLQYFIQTARTIASEFNLPAVICGGPEDREKAANTLGDGGNDNLYNLTGATSLLELLSVIANARILISNETMAPHFAALPKRTPCVVIYNGNHFGRAVPYPAELSEKHWTVYHPRIAKDLEDYRKRSNKYRYYNTLDISEISVESVLAPVRRELSAPAAHSTVRDNKIAEDSSPAKRSGGKGQSGQTLISVITVVLNGVNHLEKTITSVLNQDYENYEYIILDGGSTDGTLDILKKYDKHLTLWQSEPDAGIYDAMNKGIELSSGRLLGIINAADSYKPGVLRLAAEAYNTDPQVVHHGAMDYFKNNRHLFTVPAPEQLNKLKKGMIINHPTVFAPLSLYEKHGGFNHDLQIAADWDLMIRWWLNEVPFKTLPGVIADFQVGGASYEFNRQHIEEKHAVRKKNLLCGRVDCHYLLDRGKLILPGDWIMKATLWKKSFCSRYKR